MDTIQIIKAVILSDWASNRSSLGGRLVYGPSAIRMRYDKDNCSGQSAHFATQP